MAQIISPRGEVAFPYVFEPQAPFDATKAPMYSLTLLWDEDDPGLEKLKTAIAETATKKFGKTAVTRLANGQLRSPLRSGDDKEMDGWENKLFLTAKSKDRPQVVDDEIEPLMERLDFYAGCFARMDLYLFAYDKAGQKGVSAILNSVQKLADGERKSGRRPAADAFRDDPASAKGRKAPKAKAGVDPDLDESELL